MKAESQTAWLKQIALFVKDYLQENPGYSPQRLAEVLTAQFLLNSEDAIQLAGLVEKELIMSKLGLAAIELNLTFNCNLNCDYCFIREKSPQERMDLTTAKHAVDLLMAGAGFPNVNIILIGGEPLLEFELIKQIVTYALGAAEKRNLAITWSLTTNGTLITEEILTFFSKHKINMLLSIDGGPENHDRYRKTKSGEGTWHKLVSLLPLIKQYQPWLGARMTVSVEGLAAMQEDFKKLVELGFNQLIIAPAQGAECWSKEQITQYGVKLVKIAKDYHELKQKGVPIFLEEFEKGENPCAGWGCRAGNTSLAIAPNGDVSPCSKLLGLTDEAGRYIIGNVNKEVNFELLEPFQNAQSLQPLRCKQCSRQCTGGCYAVNFEQTGNHFIPSEETCLFWVVMQETKKIFGMLNSYGA